MKASTLLRHTKEFMLQANEDAYRSRFICDNVNKIVAPDATRERVLSHIDKLLDGEFSLHEWLHKHGHLPDAEYISNSICVYNWDEAKMQRTRMLWIDDMIKYFESQGD